MMQTNLHISKLPTSPIGYINFGVHQGVPIYKGLISYIAPNAAVGMVIDATKTVHPFTFREIHNYKGQTNRTLGLIIGKEVKFVVVDDHLTLLIDSRE